MKTYYPYKGGQFAELSDIEKNGKWISCFDTFTNAGGSVIYSDTKRALVLDDDRHTFIAGSSGCGKTLCYILITLISLIKNGESVITTDLKGELYSYLKDILEEYGYTVKVLNFSNPQVGSRWDPFYIICWLWKNGQIDKSNTYLYDLAECIYALLSANTVDSFWSSSAINYFIGIAQAILAESKGSMLSIENIRHVNSAGNEKFDNYRTYWSLYYDSMDKLSESALNIQGTVLAPNDTKGGILSVFNQPLNIYLQEGIRDMMAASDFDITEIGKKKTFVFIITPADRNVFNPIVSAFIKQSYSALIDLVANEQPDGKCPVRVNYVLDEFSNLVPIPQFNQMISMARSANIRFDLVVQSLSQLQTAYSPEEAENIINNCEAWLIFRSKDYKLHQIVKEICGNRVDEYTLTERPLISSNDIQKLSKERGEVLLLLAGADPFITTLPMIFDYPYNISRATGELFVERVPIPRKIFDIKELIRKRCQKEISSMPKPPWHNPPLPITQEWNNDMDSATEEEIVDILAGTSEKTPKKERSSKKKKAIENIKEGEGLVKMEPKVEISGDIKEIKNAKHILVNVAAGKEINLLEINDALKFIYEAIDDGAQMEFNINPNNILEDDYALKIMVINMDQDEHE